ncbi:NmrA family transcriptional regulator [Actinoplanes sp. OR16]|uniref:SDR family oxidoreductase n=1 Tax=Actinoplanes sp. OR16 TaxID=946334 RepID=UPI000F6EFC94|nr:NAD(P)H-binding protein [Actinoplanes sp. OR16]BBH64083.1 NmrA family transcriptional regulator [Actinoplanes sp. OR16]
MKAVIVGGTGQTGRLLVEALRARGHEAIPASRSTGVDVITGKGVDEVLTGADVVVDVTNAPDYGTAAQFFRESSENLTAAERTAGVGHHVVLSIVGLEPGEAHPYYRAKLGQEAAVKAGGVDYTIVRATQFFEFLDTVVGSGTSGPDVRLQPVALSDLVAYLVEIAEGAPVNGIVEIAGPEVVTIGELGSTAGSGWMGADVEDGALVAGPGARLGSTTLAAWRS